jgi:hypothetical protein
MRSDKTPTDEERLPLGVNRSPVLLTSGNSFDIIGGGVTINVEQTQDTYSITLGDRGLFSAEFNDGKWIQTFPDPKDN